MQEHAREPEVRQIILKDGYDPFEGLPKLTRIMTGVADYLSLWCEYYGLREDNIRFGRPYWRNGALLGVMITDELGRAISPDRYSVRLPNMERVFVARGYRIRRFVRRCSAFRDLLANIDKMMIRRIVKANVPIANLEILGRWTHDGRLVFKLLDQRTGLSPVDYQINKAKEALA